VIRDSVGGRALLRAVELGYFVDDDGQVIGPRGPRSTRTNKDGYHRFSVRIDGPGKRISGNIMAHQLAAYQKFGTGIFEKGVVIRHMNGDPLNNRESNLELGTHSQNMMDRTPEARLAHSKLAAKSLRKLQTPEEIAALRADQSAGMTYKQLSVKYKISTGSISYLINERYYQP